MTDRLQTVQIVSVHEPKVVAEYDIFGGVNIKIDAFTFARINYHHHYASNAHRAAAANLLLEFLGVDPKAPGVNVPAPMPSSWADAKAATLEYESWIASLTPKEAP